jgi:hypothetical protein
MGHTNSVATVQRHDLLGCDGFRLESPVGLLGWVEETWLGSSGDPAALALRTLDGRRALLLAEHVDRVLPESEVVLMHRDGRLLELGVPRLEAQPADGSVSASWRTTGEVLEAPQPPGLWRQAMLALRPWRLSPPPVPEAERPLWQLVVVLYMALGVLVGLVITIAFVAAHAS